jgi:hypothetical protein
MSKIDISQTKIRLPNDIKWVSQPGFPGRSLENAVLAGTLNGKGVYYTLVRWYPGYMSAPHHYATDRLRSNVTRKFRSPGGSHTALRRRYRRRLGARGNCHMRRAVHRRKAR